MDQLVIHRTRVDTTLVVEPVGPIDPASSPQLGVTLLDLLGTTSPGAPTTVVMRLDRVSLLDASGITALVRAHQRACERGMTFCLAAPSPAAATTLRATALADAILSTPTSPQPLTRPNRTGAAQPDGEAQPPGTAHPDGDDTLSGRASA